MARPERVERATPPSPATPAPSLQGSVTMLRIILQPGGTNYVRPLQVFFARLQNREGYGALPQIMEQLSITERGGFVDLVREHQGEIFPEGTPPEVSAIIAQPAGRTAPPVGFSAVPYVPITAPPLPSLADSSSAAAVGGEARAEVESPVEEAAGPTLEGIDGSMYDNVGALRLGAMAELTAARVNGGQAARWVVVNASNLKMLNDLFGYEVGDVYLETVFQRVERIARIVVGGDPVIARSGPNYLVFIPEGRDLGAAVKIIGAEMRRSFTFSSTTLVENDEVQRRLAADPTLREKYAASVNSPPSFKAVTDTTEVTISLDMQASVNALRFDPAAPPIDAELVRIAVGRDVHYLNRHEGAGIQFGVDYALLRRFTKAEMLIGENGAAPLPDIGRFNDMVVGALQLVSPGDMVSMAFFDGNWIGAFRDYGFAGEAIIDYLFEEHLPKIVGEVFGEDAMVCRYGEGSEEFFVFSTTLNEQQMQQRLVEFSRRLSDTSFLVRVPLTELNRTELGRAYLEGRLPGVARPEVIEHQYSDGTRISVVEVDVPALLRGRNPEQRIRGIPITAAITGGAMPEGVSPESFLEEMKTRVQEAGEQAKAANRQRGNLIVLANDRGEYSIYVADGSVRFRENIDGPYREFLSGHACVIRDDVIRQIVIDRLAAMTPEELAQVSTKDISGLAETLQALQRGTRVFGAREEIALTDNLLLLGVSQSNLRVAIGRARWLRLVGRYSLEALQAMRAGATDGVRIIDEKVLAGMTTAEFGNLMAALNRFLEGDGVVQTNLGQLVERNALECFGGKYNEIKRRAAVAEILGKVPDVTTPEALAMLAEARGMALSGFNSALNVIGIRGIKATEPTLREFCQQSVEFLAEKYKISAAQAEQAKFAAEWLYKEYVYWESMVLCAQALGVNLKGMDLSQISNLLYQSYAEQGEAWRYFNEETVVRFFASEEGRQFLTTPEGQRFFAEVQKIRALSKGAAQAREMGSLVLGLVLMVGVERFASAVGIENQTARFVFVMGVMHSVSEAQVGGVLTAQNAREFGRGVVCLGRDLNNMAASFASRFGGGTGAAADAEAGNFARFMEARFRGNPLVFGRDSFAVRGAKHMLFSKASWGRFFKGSGEFTVLYKSYDLIGSQLGLPRDHWAFVGGGLVASGLGTYTINKLIAKKGAQWLFGRMWTRFAGPAGVALFAVDVTMLCVVRPLSDDYKLSVQDRAAELGYHGDNELLAVEVEDCSRSLQAWLQMVAYFREGTLAFYRYDGSTALTSDQLDSAAISLDRFDRGAVKTWLIQQVAQDPELRKMIASLSTMRPDEISEAAAGGRELRYGINACRRYFDQDGNFREEMLDEFMDDELFADYGWLAQREEGLGERIAYRTAGGTYYSADLQEPLAALRAAGDNVVHASRTKRIAHLYILEQTGKPLAFEESDVALGLVVDGKVNQSAPEFLTLMASLVHFAFRDIAESVNFLGLEDDPAALSTLADTQAAQQTLFKIEVLRLRREYLQTTAAARRYEIANILDAMGTRVDPQSWSTQLDETESILSSWETIFNLQAADEATAQGLYMIVGFQIDDILPDSEFGVTVDENGLYGSQFHSQNRVILRQLNAAVHPELQNYQGPSLYSAD